jgi:hypothetical protein
MKVCIITEINLETGDYEVTVRNLSEPDGGIDLELLQRAWVKVNAHWVAQAKREAGVLRN